MTINKRLLFVRLATFPGQPNLLLNLENNEPTLDELVENVVGLAYPAKHAPKDLSVQIQFEPFDYRGVWIDINSTLQLSQILQAVKSQSVRFSAVIVAGNETTAAFPPPAAVAGVTNPGAALPFAPVTPPAQSVAMASNASSGVAHPTLPHLSEKQQEGTTILSQTNALSTSTFGNESLTAEVAGVLCAPLARAPTASPAQQVQKRRSSSSKKAASKRAKVTPPEGFTGKMSVSEKIIASLAELNSIGINPAPRQHVAIFSGYSNVKSAGFAKALSALKTKGDILYPNNKTVSLTAQGRSSVSSAYSPPTTNSQVHDRIKKLMQPKACQIFDLLNDGKAQSRSVVAHNSGYTNEKSAGFSKSLSTMSSLGIIQYLKDDNYAKNRLVQLTDICFPFGRPRTSPGENEDARMPDAPLASMPAVSV